jgi:hypothetical protein
MIKGKLLIAGTMNIDNEELTGVFIECDVKTLQENPTSSLYKECAVIPVKDWSAAESAANEKNDRTIFPCKYCKCKGNLSCGAEPMKGHLCELSATGECYCCRILGPEENKKRWKICK